MPIIKVAILSIGNELLNGLVLNSNANWLAQRFVEKGLSVNQIRTIGDNEETIIENIAQLSENNNILIITGGLGTTPDDKTQAALIKFFNTSNIYIPAIADDIKNKLIKRNKEQNLPFLHNLAYQPQNAIILNNRLGLAPGMFFNTQPCKIASLPGVPFEMKTIFNEELWQLLNPIFNFKPLLQHHFLVTGIGESQLSQILNMFEKELPNSIQLAYLPHLFITKLYLSSANNDTQDADFNLQVEKLRFLIKDYSICEENLPFEQFVAHKMIEKNASLAVTESCTGGYLSHLLTKHQGASNFFYGSVTAYNNTIKSQILKISNAHLTKYGSFSQEVTSKMAISIKKKFKSDFAIATNGFMDPYIDENGHEFKGILWIAIATPLNVYCHKIPLFQDRLQNIEFSSFFSLYLLFKYLYI